MSNCKNCIFPDKCVNFGKEFCKTKTQEIKFKPIPEGSTEIPELSEAYQCRSECFKCKYDTTCIVSDNYKNKENENE